MPLRFPSRAPVDETRRHNAAQIEKITIDNRLRTISVEVMYGDIVDGQFRQNKNLSLRTHVLGSLEYAALGQRLPTIPTGGMYENIKQLVWDRLVAMKSESGVIE